MRFAGSEYIQNWTITATTPGKLYEIALNPVSTDLPSLLRLRQMASSFGKFRFKKAQLTIATNFATTVSGNYMIGYSENPDLQLATLGSNDLSNQVYNLGGRSCPFWSPVRYPAKFRDTSRWYNIDADSTEVMMTTQGKFVIAIQQMPSATLPLNIPVLLDYEIEFCEPALQNKTTLSYGAPLTKTATTFVQRDQELRGQYHVATGPLPTNTVYRIMSGASIPTALGVVEASFVAHYTNAEYSHGFYRTFADAVNAQNPIVANVLTGDSFILDGLELRPVSYQA